MIAISPQVSARVLAVHIEDNQLVRKGDPLVELDPTDSQVALAQVRAAEAGARGKLAQAKAQVTAGAAGVKEATSAVEMAEISFRNSDADLKRYESLDQRGPVQTAVRQRRHGAEDGRRPGRPSEGPRGDGRGAGRDGDGRRGVGRGRRRQGPGRRPPAEVNLGYCKVVAPSDGRVTRRSVEPGAYVTPAQALLAVVPPNVWVVANYKETQLEDMRVGQPVTVSVDAFGGADLTGKIDSIQAGTGSRFSLLPAETRRATS